MINKNQKFNFIDLFAGCGGLSEGFYRQGFNAVAHVEIDHSACETLRERMRYYGYPNPEKEVIEADINSDDILKKINDAEDGRNVDVIIGGPPCQAYSTAGRVRDKVGMENDPRNFLFESYVKILEHYLPKIFVFENVTGLFSAKVKGELIFPQIIDSLGKLYNVTSDPETILFNAANYGVPQTRKRIILIGVRKDIDTCDIDYPCDNEFLKAIGKPGVHALMDHICRKHNKTDIERFQVMIKNNWTFGEMRTHRPDLEHERPRLFNNSYVVQWWNLPSKTILAHIHKDGFQYIHPDYNQARTFTVREAARIQSFPDDFVFKGSRGDKFKQIGNAVPCLFAEAIAKAIKKTLIKISHDIQERR